MPPHTRVGPADDPDTSALKDFVAARRLRLPRVPAPPAAIGRTLVNRAVVIDHGTGYPAPAMRQPAVRPHCRVASPWPYLDGRRHAAPSDQY